jgi:chemotaxis protein CheC
MSLPPEDPSPAGRSLMATTYNEIELDALREVANIGSSTAATALSSLIGMPVAVSTPAAHALPLADAIEQAGPGELVVTAVLLGVTGDLQALVLMVMRPPTETVACELLGVDPRSDYGRSALVEIGNILGAAYLGALSTLTGLVLDASPPELVSDMLGAVLTSAVLVEAYDDEALLLESTLSVDDVECSPMFMFIPTQGSVGDILRRLGMPA